MAVFQKGREGFLGGDIDWNTNKIKAILVDMNDAGPAAGAWVVTGVTSSGTAPNILATITTSVNHGLTAGQRVEVFSVLGSTQVNGVWTVNTVPTLNTFTINMASTTVSAYTSGGYVANLSLTFLSEFVGTAGRVGQMAAAATLGTPTILNGVADADPVTFTAVPGPDPVEAILVVQAALTTGATDLADTAQRLIWLNTPVTPGTSGLPVTPNGGDITVTWNASGLFEI